MKLRKTAIKATSGRRLTGKNPSKTARKSHLNSQHLAAAGSLEPAALSNVLR
jgi:hypothetical protein